MIKEGLDAGTIIKSTSEGGWQASPTCAKKKDNEIMDD